MSKTRHTPGPWSIDKTQMGIVRTILTGTGGRAIAQVWTGERPADGKGPIIQDAIGWANAEFIVRACNNFEKMAEALKECITEDGACCLAHDDKAMMKKRLAYITETARAALKAAGIE